MTDQVGSIELQEKQNTDISHWESHGRIESHLQSNDRLLQKIDGYFTDNGIAIQVAVNKNKISWLSKFVWGLFLTFMTTGLGAVGAFAFKKFWP